MVISISSSYHVVSISVDCDDVATIASFYDIVFVIGDLNVVVSASRRDLVVAKKIDVLVKKKGWDVKKKLNKWYVGWKYGSFNVFGVIWIGTKSFAIFFKVDEEALKSIDVFVKPLRYESQWSQALYKVDPDNYNVETLIPLFEASLKNITGQ